METTDARAIAAEGARVGIVTCLECGAALLVDPSDDVSAFQLHAAWHAKSAPPASDPAPTTRHCPHCGHYDCMPIFSPAKPGQSWYLCRICDQTHVRDQRGELVEPPE